MKCSFCDDTVRRDRAPMVIGNRKAAICRGCAELSIRIFDVWEKNIGVVPRTPQYDAVQREIEALITSFVGTNGR